MDECRGNGLHEGILKVEGIAVEMDPVITHEIYLIGYEAIRNAFQHSGGSRVEVQIIYARDFALRIRDNGQGIDSKVAADGREGHFGLKSMRERAGRIDGQLQLITAPQKGTTIELCVPGKIAFRSNRKVRSAFSRSLARIKQSKFKFQKSD